MTTFPIIIVGNGLAGLSLARNLLEAGVPGAKILILGDPESATKASQAPCAICHPFPGQSFQLRPHVLQAFSVACEFLSNTPAHLRRQTRVNRWLSSEHGQRDRLLKSYDRIQHRLSGSVGVKKKRPSLTHPEHVTEVFEIEPAWVANLEGICSWMRNALEVKGVAFESFELKEMEKNRTRWILNGGIIEGEQVVLALGAGLPSFFPELPSQKVWGHLVQGDQVKEELEILIGDGHLSSMEGALWGGASFLPQKEKPTVKQEKAALNELATKMAVLSGASFPITEVWRGTRLVMGHERLPIAGEIPGLASCFAIGGAGASGLLWLPFLAQQLAVEMQVRREAVPEAFQPNRYDVDCWRPDRKKIKL